MKRLTLLLTALFSVLIALVVIRTMTFTSRQLRPPSAEKLQLDKDAIVTRLSEAIQFKTISFEQFKTSSFQSGTESNPDPFRDFHAFLAKSFPRVHAQLTREVVNDHSLLYTWNGKDDRLKPILLMAHMDVVPVDPDSGSWDSCAFFRTGRRRLRLGSRHDGRQGERSRHTRSRGKTAR